MTLYAAYAGVPIVELDDFSGYHSEELFLNMDECIITYPTKELFISRVNDLIKNKEKRKLVLLFVYAI